MSAAVQGYCPMGCGETLYLADGGYVTCSGSDCPSPTAVADLLKDQETQHIVVFREGDWSMQHPMRERLEGELFDCEVNRWVSALDGPPVAPGRYRAQVLRGAAGELSMQWELAS